MNSLQLVHGAHTIKFGGEFRHLAEVFREQQQPVGNSRVLCSLYRIARRE